MIPKIVQLRDEDSLDEQSGDEQWSDSGYILKNEPETKHLEGAGVGIRDLGLDIQV